MAVMTLLQKNKQLAWMLLLLSVLLLLTIFISLTIRSQSMQYSEAAFEQEVDDLIQSIQLKMRDNEQILVGVKGLYEASQTVEREEFHKYVSSFELTEKYPGIQLIGFSQWLPPSQLEGAIKRVRADGFPQFTIRPQGERDNYTMIIYAEPFTGRNLAAFGFDMFSEPVRRKAMTTAVETHQTTLSNKVTLVQESQGAVQAGALLYMPIYKKNMPTATVSERWNALEGFVYAAFRMIDLMESILPQRSMYINYVLYAGESANKTQELYSYTSEQKNFLPDFTDTRQLNLFGQPWFLQVSNNSLFQKRHNSYTSLVVFVIGFFISCLLCIIFYVLASQRQRALIMTKEMTADVREKHVELKNNQQRLALALESSLMGVWSLNLSDKHVQWDNSMYALFGLINGSELSSYESFLSLVHNDDRQRVFEEIAKAIEGKQGYDTEYRVVWPDHSIHYLASRAKIIYEGSEATSMIGTCWDITEHKRLDRIKTEFVSTVSHELRTPLTAITGALGVALSGTMGELSEKIKQLLDIAYKNSQRLTLLINDLLDMDKLLAGKLEFHCEPQRLKSLIERALSENKAYADQMHVHFVMVPIDINPKVNIEGGRFLQVMANFLSNAAKFSKADSNVFISLNNIDGYARVSVTDMGVGLSEDSKLHIFEKFYQADASDSRKKGGTGLGLAITKEIVERMNGRVGFTSVLGEGSTFYAEFPIIG
ncbi:MAG: PAS domain S-box protein [Gammaproteobacteria bacterium]|nr:MAG: PAS domain S-box protein [Gammaproteobacteria bacterium]